MNFSEVDQGVTDWLKGHREFSLLYKDEAEFRFTFTSTHTKLSNFYIVREVATQSAPDSGFELLRSRWGVSSDLDDVYENLKVIREDIKCKDSMSIDVLLDAILEVCSPTEFEDEMASDNLENVCADEDDDDDEYNPDDWPDDETSQEPPHKVAGASEMLVPASTSEQYQGSAYTSCLALKRLCDDVQILSNIQGKYGFSGGPQDDNLLVWDIKLTDFEKGTKEKPLLGNYLEIYAMKWKREEAILLEMVFPSDYPMAPPFVRILRPKFKFLTGHVTVGGSICLQMLTKSGWSPSNDIESTLVQIRAAILSDPNAQIDLRTDEAYSSSEAHNAFNRMKAKYGW